MEKGLKLSSAMESSLVSVVVISLVLCSTVVVEGIAAPTGTGISTSNGVAATPAAGPAAAGASSNDAYIVYTDRPDKFHLESIFPIFGGEQAARAAILYKYKGTANYYGFSIKLTPEQVTTISKLPGVVQVVKSKNCNLQKQRNPAIH